MRLESVSTRENRGKGETPLGIRDWRELTYLLEDLDIRRLPFCDEIAFMDRAVPL